MRDFFRRTSLTGEKPSVTMKILMVIIALVLPLNIISVFHRWSLYDIIGRR